MRRRGANGPHPTAAGFQRCIDVRPPGSATRRSPSFRMERDVVTTKTDLADAKRPLVVRKPSFAERTEGENGSERPVAVPNLKTIDEKSARGAKSRPGARHGTFGATGRRSVATTRGHTCDGKRSLADRRSPWESNWRRWAGRRRRRDERKRQGDERSTRDDRRDRADSETGRLTGARRRNAARRKGHVDEWSRHGAD